MKREDCRPENLEWVTPAENKRRSRQNNNKRKSSAPALSKPVKARRLDGTIVGQFGSASEAARELFLHPRHVSNSATTGGRCKEYYFERVEQQDLEGEVWVELTPEILDFVRTKTHGAKFRHQLKNMGHKGSTHG
jgi:hypothetical protein